MWREIVRQLLTFALALLGALLGVVAGMWFVPDHPLDPRAWQLALVLAFISMGLVTYLIGESRRFEYRVRIVGQRLRREIDRAATLESNYREGLYRADAELLDAIDTWGARIDAYLARYLPESGADVRFRTGIGEIGPDKSYEPTRLRDLKGNLTVILDALPSYVMRSRWQPARAC